MKKSANRLLKEQSPYLRQHGENPVDWYPWGEDAFIKAKETNKPVFLSIGYSTCHWCHVMAKESFEDLETAEYLNENFIAIKVDREERPDIDQIYMNVCLAMTGQGGWPLSLFLTPDKKPFFAGTYFPKENKWGKMSFLALLKLLRQKWEDDNDLIVAAGERFAEALQPECDEAVEDSVSLAAINKEAYERLKLEFDAVYGGFGPAPKFPMPHTLLFLLRYWKRTGENVALQMVEKTLKSMKAGGLYDHLGSGFARYSVDEKWKIPHFEKMLYDNALLVYAYTDAYQATGNEEYRQVIAAVLNYIRREMTSPEGAFYSAQDADSEGCEGKFYVWSQDEIMDVLGGEEGKIFADYYDVSGQGNFIYEKNHLNHIGREMLDFSAKWGMTLKEVERLLEKCLGKLFKERTKRIHPAKDDKILFSWNCLLIAALAKAARVLRDDEYLQEAKRAMDFLFQHMVREDGRILARYRSGEAAFLGYLDDYAFGLWALLELYEADLADEYLEKAMWLAEEMESLFGAAGAYYFTGSDAEKLLVRPQEIYDGAMPAGNSVAVWSLLRLAGITGKEIYSQWAKRVMDSVLAAVSKYPRGYTCFLLAAELELNPLQKLVLVGSKEEVKGFNQAAADFFLPSLAVSRKDREDNEAVQARLCFVQGCLPSIMQEDKLRQELSKMDD